MPSDSLVEALVDYRRLVASRYRAIKPTELGDLPAGELWLSPKIDGELAGIEFRDGGASLATKGGREIPDCPLFRELCAAASRVNGPLRIVGELHCRAERGSRPRVGDVSAALAGNASLLERLAFAGFDLLAFEGQSLPADHEQRLDAIRSALAGLGTAVAVETRRTADRSEIRGAWQDWCADGRSEGMVARTADGRIFKIKPDISIDAVIMAFTTRCDAPNQVRSVLLGLVRDDGSHQLIGGLGGVGSSSQRESLYAQLSGMEVASSLRQPSSDGGIFRFVRPGVIAEVNCTDVQSEDSTGQPLQRWMLGFDGKCWHGLAMAPGVSLLHPQMVRIRADKQATPSDAGFSQVAQRCTPPAAERRDLGERGSATVAVRRVWTKGTKGKMAVRKLLVWSTGREHEGWPAWVVHFTDYSPERKTPLERTFRAARSRPEAEAIAARTIEENVKKGWEPVV
jgi:ATP-dependent DNA ligase